MMPKRVDANQRLIVKCLRDMGAKVLPIHMIGRGVPDILCCYRGRLFLVEIKDGAKPPSKRKLTPDEQKFHDEWECVHIVKSIDEAIALLTTH